MSKSTSKLFESETPKEMAENAMNLPETDGTETGEKTIDEVINSNPSPVSETADDIIDLNLSAIKKKRVRINKDPNRILELNISDLSITQRMSAAYERLMNYMDEVGKVLSDIPENDTDEEKEKEKLVEDKLKEIDDKMRKELDFIFDAPVSEVCDYGGSMYDPFEGMFRFEHIMDNISKLYETNLNDEFNKMRRRINTKTSKYTKKYHK